MTPRSDSADSSSTLSTSSSSMDENISSDDRSAAVERFYRHIDAYTKALNTIKVNLQTLNQEKATLAAELSNLSPTMETVPGFETIDLIGLGGLRGGGAIILTREYLAKSDRVDDKERMLEMQLVVLEKWVSKSRGEIEGFVKGKEDTVEDKEGRRGARGWGYGR